MESRWILAVASVLVSSLSFAPHTLAGTASSPGDGHLAQYWDTCSQMGWEDVEFFETEDFYVNICQEEDQLYFVGERKDGTGMLDFPIVDRSEVGYIIQNGDRLYTIDRQRLVIRQGETVIDGDLVF
ncbi:MAG: hypothetical protein J7641_15065 [Cyanobacteria bacterium SID2]|nr:hypothetical protein [Cyanobacteria bacterium SID2]MBP0003449.1 hypothetical protein [Cyanobacteria bacterium SBC]